jgi:hypothetical protein
VSAGAKGPEVDQTSEKLWEAHIHDRPAGRIIDNWELAEGLPLCKEAGDVGNRLAAFATVAFYGGPRARINEFAFTEKQLTVAAQEIKGSWLTKKEKSRVLKLLRRARRQYGDRKGAAFYGTFLMGAALSLEKTIGAAGSIERCVQKIGKFHGWLATVESGTDLPYERFEESIDRHIPVLIERQGRYEVCVGYLETGQKRHLVIADLSKTPMERKGMTYLPDEKTYFESLPPDHPERIAYENARKRKEFVTDLVVSSEKPLMPGFRIEPFERGRYTAYFIHQWRQSTEAWREEIIDIVGKPKEERRKNERGD